MVILDEHDVARLLPMELAIARVDAAARAIDAGTIVNSPRRRAIHDGASLHLMGAVGERYAATKTYRANASGAEFWVLLFHEEKACAVIAGDMLGRIRTGAASGVATRALARADARTLTVFGTGSQAITQIEAVVAVRSIERIIVCGRDGERTDAFAAETRRRFSGRDVSAVAGVERFDEAAAQGDVVVTITSAREPLFRGEALRVGAHVNAAGSNRATNREIDDALLARAAIIVGDDVEQARLEAGDFLRANAFDFSRVRTLGEVLRSAPPRAPGDVTLFESLGLGAWDLAAASAVYEAALAEGAGQTIGARGVASR